MPPPGRAAHVRRARRSRSTRSRAGCSAPGSSKGDRVGIWAPNCAEWVLVQFATAKAGIDPRQRQPGLPDDRARVRAAPVRLPDAVAARAFKTSDYAAMIDEVRGDLAALEQVVLLDSPEWDGARGRRVDGPSADARRRSTATTRSTSSTRAAPRASPRAPRSATTTSSTTATSSARAAATTEADRVCIPVPFYHCFGMVMGNLGVRHPRRGDGHPGGGVRARGGARRGAGGALHVALRRADDVHRRARATRDFADVRPVVAAHRDHGRLAVPGRGHEAASSSSMHMARGDHLLRHDRDVAGVDADRAPTTRSRSARDRRPRAPAPRGQARRPATGRHRRARRARRAAAPAATR